MNISRNTALEILGLKEGFSEEELRKQYRKLVKIVHPDNGGDKTLFELIVLCKNTLQSTENALKNSQYETTQETKNYKTRDNFYIRLEELEDMYDYLYMYERKYNIVEIKASIIVFIRPKYKKNLQKCYTIFSTISYKSFKQLGIVKISETVRIPEEMKKFRKFSIRVEFLGDTFKFNVSDGTFKVVKHKKYEYVECLNCICELHFKK